MENKTMREPLDKMTTVERCLWFAEELQRISKGHKGTTEWEEARVLQDAANEILSLRNKVAALERRTE